MDLLFKEYASPFPLLDGFIQTSRMSDFIDVFIDKYNERFRWNYYLHQGQYMDESWKEFNDRLDGKTISQENLNATPEQLEATVSASWDMMQNFIPEERGTE